jgi:hypothetical protein
LAFDITPNQAFLSMSSGSVTKSGVIILGQDNDHPPPAAATIEGLVFLKRLAREPGLQGGEDV